MNRNAKFFLLFIALFALWSGMALDARRKFGRSRSVTATFLTAAELEKDFFDVAIIGGGVAGLSAALVTTEYAAKTLVFTGSKPYGPLYQRTPVGNVPGIFFTSGDSYINELIRQVERGKAFFSAEEVIGIDFAKKGFLIRVKSGTCTLARALIIATGSRPLQLSVPGENKFRGRGIVYDLADDDGIILQGKKQVIVVGGGDDAVRKALKASKSSQQVTLLVRGSTLRASPMRSKRLKKAENVKIVYNASVIAINGSCENMTSLEAKIEGKLQTLNTDLILVAIGRLPITDFLNGAVDMTPSGYVRVAHKSQNTSVAGIFAAGAIVDGSEKYGQAAIMAAQGMMAGYDAIAYLSQLKGK